MDKYLNEHFLPIYEKNVSKIEMPIPATQLQKWVDGLFHQKAFELWLGKKYSDVKNVEDYFEFYTEENFKKFMIDFDKVKNSIENHKRRKKIENDILKDEKYPEIKKEPYDVDIVATYYKIEKLLESVVLNKGVDKKQYLEAMMHPIVLYCKKYNLSFEYVIENKYYSLVFSTFYKFHEYMGRELIAYDETKIDAFLESHKTSWLGEGFYPSIVEHGVYNYVKNHSPFDNSKRLKAIMDWVKENREFVFIDNENKAVYKKGKEPKIISIETDLKNPDVKNVSDAKNKKQVKTPTLDWSPTVDKKYLKELSKEIKSKGYTKKLTDFEKVFTHQQKTIWLKEPEFLAYLLYKLNSVAYNAVKADKKGHFKAAQIYFCNCIDKVAKEFKEGELKYLNHNVIKRSAQKHFKLRSKVDKMLEAIIKK